MSNHTVEKIGGSSMSRAGDLVETIFVGERESDAIYGRIFVVSAFGGITDLLLEHKKSGQSGVYALFAEAGTNDGGHEGWSDALSRVGAKMIGIHGELLDDIGDRQRADAFVRDRIEGARACMIDLQRLCSYGHFRIEPQLQTLRELLSGLGEAHSAFVASLLLNRRGVNARFVDLTGWRDDRQPALEERLGEAMEGIDLSRDLPIVTGYAQCREGLMREYDRGYTEVVFARLAALTGAREAIIHKEFHLSSADPKIVGLDAVRKIGRTSYDVADQLSNLGMEAIHPNAAKILRQADVPLRVRHAFEPDDPGTFIGPDAGEKGRVEMVTGLGVYAFELFEPDMVGAKGYDSAILEALARHKVWIVSKTSNANCITHWLSGSLKAIKRVERDLAARFPNAEITTRNVALVSVIGSDLSELGIMRRSLDALWSEGIAPMAMQQGTRRVDVQFMVAKDQMEETIRTLHHTLIGEPQDHAAPRETEAAAA
ncbi:aspartate kinase [Pikeienuella piscinae]|uniref:aspartate kinase n=1 Tax=Pikeienuella piscinae TaxID=2748098 RepID=A0A7M3T5L1_9RHOB|nr:aspartate kinase [Pikeienuella piscinae]QIE57292.1 aspartate kinase [Pikeienuella piscinae]